ncbi:MAG: GAF domain-containing protein, partial [Candidatus Brocadiia bacterium]
MKAEHTFGPWYSRSSDFLSRNCGVSKTQWLSFASIVASGGTGEELDHSIAALISGGADLAVIAAALVELSKVMGKDDDKPLFSPFLSPIQAYLHRRLGARGNKTPIYRLSAGTISLFEDSPAAIYLFTSSGQLATANRAGIALIGQQRMAPLQRRLSLREHPLLVDPPLSSLKRSLAGEAVSLNSVTLDPVKWGADMGGRVFSIAASPISLSDDRVDFILISVAETIGSEGGEQVRRFTRQVEMLGKIAQTVGLEGNLERAMADVLGRLTETVFVGSTLFLVDGEELIMHSWSGIPEPFARRQAILQVGQMSPGRCAQSGALTTLDPVSIEDEESRLMLVSGFVSRVNLPIIFHGRTIGVLSLLGNRKVQLTRELRSTLEAVGAQIGMGIENSRMVADLQRRADSLEIQRDLTQEMMDAMGDAVLALDSNEKIAFHNQRFYDLTRYTKEELAGKPWRDFVSGGSEAFQNVLSESREKGEPVFCECRWRKNDGSSFSGFTGICPRLGADGGLAGFVVSIADLTERRHLEELLARQNEELRLLNEVADVIATSMEISDVGRDALEIISSRFDANFSVIYLPADSDGHLQARASVGLTDSELLRVEFCSVEGIVGSAFRTGEIQEHVGRGAKDLIEGLHENYRVIAVPLEARGQICGVLVIGRAGRRKFLESDLRLLRILSPQLGISLTNLSLVESMQAEAAKSAGLAQITTELLASPAEERFTALALQRIIDSLALDFAAILRVTPEVCTVAGCAPIGCPDGLDTFAKALPQLLDTLDTEENRWIERAQKADNKIIRDFAAIGGIKSMALIPVVVNGRRKALLLLVQTQFARRFPQLDREFIRALAGQFSLAYRSSELVRELRSVNMELQTLDEMKSNLLANVSHELRTPLVSVRGYIEMTLGGFLGEVSERQSKGLRVALRNVDRLVALIENLLNFARMERGDEKLQLTRFVLADLVAEIAAGFDPVLRDRGINLIVEIPGSMELFADREKILRLLTNLLDNAAKFTPKQGNISVSAGLDDRGTHTSIEVGDSGPGIPPDERERIFERFYQVDSASTRRFGGTGIGLSICRDIVRMHGGDITALSSPLGGALMR